MQPEHVKYDSCLLGMKEQQINWPIQRKLAEQLKFQADECKLINSFVNF